MASVAGKEVAAMAMPWNQGMDLLHADQLVKDLEESVAIERFASSFDRPCLGDRSSGRIPWGCDIRGHMY